MTAAELLSLYIIVFVATVGAAFLVAMLVTSRVQRRDERDGSQVYNWVDTTNDPDKRGVYATYFRNQPRPEDVFVMDDGRVIHIDSVDTRNHYLECHEMEIEDVHGGDNDG